MTILHDSAAGVSCFLGMCCVCVKEDDFGWALLPACSTPAPLEVLGATIVRVQTPVSQPEMFGARTIVPQGHAERCNYSLAEDILLPR